MLRWMRATLCMHQLPVSQVLSLQRRPRRQWFSTLGYVWWNVEARTTIQDIPSGCLNRANPKLWIAHSIRNCSTSDCWSAHCKRQDLELCMLLAVHLRVATAMDLSTAHFTSDFASALGMSNAWSRFCNLELRFITSFTVAGHTIQEASWWYAVR